MEFAYVDLKVHWKKEMHKSDGDNEGKHFGIYTYEVPLDEVGTDNQFNNDISHVEWFETEAERDKEFNDKPYFL